VAATVQGSDPGDLDTSANFALRYIIPGFAGSLLMMLGSLGVGWLPLDSALNSEVLVEALRNTTAGSVISRIAVLLGVALLLQSWLVLGFAVMHQRMHDLRRLWWTLAAWSAPLLVALPMFSRDVYSYFAQGQLLVAGSDPYSSGVVEVPGWFGTGADPLWGESPAPYGPFFLILERGVADFAAGNPLLGAYVFRLIAVVGVVLMAWAVPLLARAHGISGAKAFWLVALNPLVLMHFIVGVHNDALLAGFITVGFLLAVKGQPLPGVVLVVLAGAVKPIGLIALPFIGLIWAGRRAGWGRRIWYWVLSGVVAIVTFAVLGLISGTGLGWLEALATPGQVRTWLSPPTAVGMVLGQLGSWVGITSVDTMVTVVRLLAQLVAIGLLAWLVLKPEGRSPTRGAGLAFMLVVILGPVVQPWYVLWGLPLLVAAGLRRNEFRIVLFGTALLTLHALATSSSTQDTLFEVSEGIGLLLVAAIIAVVLLTSPRERRLLLGAPGDNGLLPDNPIAAGIAASQLVTGPTRTKPPS